MGFSFWWIFFAAPSQAPTRQLSSDALCCLVWEDDKKGKLRDRKNPQHRHEGLGTMLREDPGVTTQKRGTGNHAKDGPGGCWVSSFALGFCWSSYLPIIVECCWTAASRSLSSIVHSPISEHPEKTNDQRYCVQIPQKGLYFLSEFSLFLVVVRLQRVRKELKKAPVTGCSYCLPPVSVRYLVGCVLRAQRQEESSCACWALPQRGHAVPCHQSVRADYCKPSYFRSSDQVDGLGAASEWRQVGFNVLPALIRP